MYNQTMWYKNRPSHRWCTLDILHHAKGCFHYWTKSLTIIKFNETWWDLMFQWWKISLCMVQCNFVCNTH